MVEELEARLIPSAPQVPYSLSFTAAPAIDGLDSTTRVHRASFSDSRDGSCIPLLQTESIQLGDLDSSLLAEVKDVLIPHEHVVTHSNQVIGKGIMARPGGAGAEMSPEMTWPEGTIGQDSALDDLGHTIQPL